MAKPDRFEILILGSGAGGKLLAWQLAKAGHHVAAVERRWIGGSCPNIACLPTKNEIWSARAAHMARHAAEFGTITGPVSVDMARVRQRKRDMVAREVAFHIRNYKATGVELIMGGGRFVGPKTVEIRLNDGGTRVLEGEKIFLNLGTHAVIPPVEGLEAAHPLTHVEALELGYAPAHLVVLGAGYAGLELAQAFRRFGSRVTVVEAGPQIMSREDSDIAEEIGRILGEEGVEIVLGAELRAVSGRSGTEVSVTVRTAAGERKIVGSDILVAAGRRPNTAGIGLETAGVELDERGYVRVNDKLETTAAGIWAIGECAGSPHFTHVSVDDFRIILTNLAGGARSTSGRLVPFCMFTEPPLAHVGLNERAAQRQGVAVRVGRLPVSAVLRAATTGETQGFMKVLVGAKDDRILGFTMIGAEAGEVMAVVQAAMLGNLPYTALRDAILAHPTMAEGLGSLMAGVPAASAQ